jgi:serine/threonine-protein kinase
VPELQIPGFEIIEKLGEGGMATVWKARQVSLDRIVAVKILSSRIASDPSDVERFQSEARAAAKLKHPGLVQVYDANALEGTYYFVMEYIAGYTVGDWAKRKGTLSEQDTLLVAECVTDALQYAWKTQKIVHCDIKPDNVMVDSDGTVKVADLGLARSLSAVQSEQATDEIVGTPAFMSPEQCRGEPDLDCRSDMYSLGAMLYYLLTGRLLFAGNDDEKVIELQETGTVDDIVDVNPGVSHNVCWLVEKLLAKNKQDRHADWESVRKDLTRVKRGHPPAKPLPSEGKSTLRRNPVRNKIQQVRPAYMQDTEADSFRGAKFLIAGGLVVIIGAGVLLLALQPRDPADMEPVRVRKQVSTPTTIPEEAVDREEHSAREMFEFADQWARKHPGEFERAVEKFTKVVKQTRGTKYALMAEDRIRELVSKREKRISAVLDSLEAKADRLADREKYREAAGLYANYSGPYAEETADRRKGRADALVEKARLLEEREKKRIAARKQRFEKLLEGICATLVADGVDAALARTKDSMEEFDLAKEKSSLKEIRRLLAEASRIDEKILESFREEKGREVAISLDDRQIKATILNVVDGKVHCRENLDVGASRRLSFGIDDLSAREKLGRMGNSDDPDTRRNNAISRDICAVQRNQWLA